MRRSPGWFFSCALASALTLAACGDDDDGSTPDAGETPDAGPGEPQPLSTAHCTYRALPPTARSGGTVVAGAIQVGVAELPLGLPVGAALGGNTSRAAPLDAQGRVDARQVALCGSFTPSVGVETIPMIKAVAITAGDETMVLLRTDTIFGDDTITHEVTERLGPELAGKVLWASSHTHTAAAQYSSDAKYQVGAGRMRDRVRRVLIDRMVEAAQAALGARVPARIGIATDEDFDPENRVSYDRRDVNDDLFGGEARKDRRLAMIRIDREDGTPMVILPLFGVHSAILDDDVSVFSTDASGAFERLIEEQFDRPVTVIHLQGAAGDVLGESQRHLEIPGGELQWDFARNEECARWALPELMAVWERAGEVMQSELAMEVVTRSVELGPDWRTFTVRDGALSYAPWDGVRPCDREIWADEARTSILSPIDEFNAPGGAGLCGDGEPVLRNAQLPNVQDLGPYHSCQQLGTITRTLSLVLDFEFGTMPICHSTRTTITAWRLGDYMFASAPGEPLVLWRDHLAEDLSPFPAERTFVIGYAQGHNGYLLTPEDWLRGGFEPTINSWGPLEGQYLAERLRDLMALAASEAREDAAAGGADRVVAPPIDDRGTAMADPAPMAGTVPGSVPEAVFFRNRVRPGAPQPSPTIERVNGVARFVWIGEDPLSGTPRVTLQREVDGAFVAATRRSGREVHDLDLIVIWTPLPLERTPSTPRTHHWTVEWQAVGWELGALEERAGAPLGRYRFHVEGTGYTLDSEPFEVVRGGLEVAARREDAQVIASARFQPAEGWRLLRMEGLSNRDVPAEAGPFTVEIEYESGAPDVITEVAASAPGEVRVTPTRAATITRVVVRDRYGNEGAAAL